MGWETACTCTTLYCLLRRSKVLCSPIHTLMTECDAQGHFDTLARRMGAEPATCRSEVDRSTSAL